jgi:hypothetical protein
MEHDFDIFALEQIPELGGRSDGKRVDNRASFARGDLEQVDAIQETMETRTFSIEGELLDVRYFGEKAVYRVRLVEVESAVGVGRRH